MDPITTAIVAALTAGVSSGISDTAKTMITDAYHSLKNLLRKKFGEKSPLITSVEILEAKPDSVGRQKTLEEEIIDMHVSQDQEVLLAAQHLLQLMRTQQGGERHIQHIIGNYNAVVQGSGNATVNVNMPDQP
jgi:hypothetical protein